MLFNRNFWGSFEGNYVYAVKVDGVNRYIGRGVGARYKHPLSGKSSCVQLNRDLFEGKHIQVWAVEDNLSKEEAIKLEKEWILICNTIRKDSLYNIRS
tara:strand:+ start:80697 stop:80990 length:294 start_codon:yes stop_codon:yes gene_type:complete